MLEGLPPNAGGRRQVGRADTQLGYAASICCFGEGSREEMRVERARIEQKGCSRFGGVGILAGQHQVYLDTIMTSTLPYSQHKACGELSGVVFAFDGRTQQCGKKQPH